jgi:tetratricopeptide (TPR) repeat protein
MKGIYDTFRLFVEQFGRMKIAVLLAALSVSVPSWATAQSRPIAPAPPDKVAEAYAQFLLGHRLDEHDDEAGAIAAYKRAMELDPLAADIPAELAGLYLRQNNAEDARTTAERALKIAPANREANRVMGIVYAAMVDDNGRGAASRARGSSGKPDENLAKAIQHLELAISGAVAESDPNVRATLARLYLRSESFDKAIGLLTNLVNEESGWQDGPLLLAEAYASAGRNRDAIAWLEQRTADDPRLLPALADFYEREQRWKDAVNAYARAVRSAPRSVELKTRYASALLKAGGRDAATKARDVLNDIASTRTPDARVLYMLSQAERRSGDSTAAEATARRVIAQNSKSPWGYFALAEALEERHQYQAVIDELSPLVADQRSKSNADPSLDVSVLLPHLAFAYQELGQHDKAIATFEDARRRSPKDPNVAAYLVEANIAAKKYAAAVDVAKSALTEHPDHLRLTRLEAQALRHSGRAGQGIALLEDAVKKHAEDPTAYVALAELYADTDRGAEAVKVLQDAQTKFPSDNAIVFELGAVYDKQKKFADAEAAFHQVLGRDPENAPALNYLGYMLAERGERLDESVNYLKKALQIEPENGSYLDSLGWAYFKADKLNLAEDNLRRAADQLRTNSVIQEHYGEVLFKLGRYDEAIAAWMRALAGDGSDIARADIDRKIRSAKQKLNKK